MNFIHPYSEVLCIHSDSKYLSSRAMQASRLGVIRYQLWTFGRTCRHRGMRSRRPRGWISFRSSLSATDLRVCQSMLCCILSRSELLLTSNSMKGMVQSPGDPRRLETQKLVWRKPGLVSMFLCNHEGLRAVTSKRQFRSPAI